MPKIYQAYYKDSEGKLNKHHGASLVKVEHGARLTAQEVGREVFVDVVEIEKPSLKLVIEIYNNGLQFFTRTPICSFRQTEEQGAIDKETGAYVRRWKVKKISCEGVQS